MFDIYLTPASISYLTQFILALAITLFLLNRLRSQRTDSLLFLTAFFAPMTVFIGLLVFNAALLPFHRLLTAYAENTVLALALVALIWFAYHFPERFPQCQWEMRILLTLSLIFLFWEAGFMVYRYISLLGQGNVFTRFPLAAYSLPVVVLFSPAAFLRQTLAADPRRVAWWRKLWKPEGKGAQGARNFALVFCIPFVLGLTSILPNLGFPISVVYAAASIGILVMLWLFASNYVNFIPGSVNVASRLSILTLTLFLALIGTLGWLIAPPYIATFQPDLKDNQTLRFTPNATGGYEVSEVAFRFEPVLGEKVRAQDLDENGNHRVEFSFPFYGETYTELYVTDAGVISLGLPFQYLNLQASTARVPTLFPLLVYLNLTLAEGDSGLYVRRESEQLIVTWNRLPTFYEPEVRYTFQSVLYADGTFEFTYNGLPQPILFNSDDFPWQRGVVAGRGEPLHELPDTEAVGLIALSQNGGSPLLENFHLAFRRYLHTFMLPVAWVVIGGSLLILLIIPVLLRASISKPLEALTTGVRRMGVGEMHIAIPVQSEDEIGFLTGAFNTMSGALNDLVHNLEMRVANRTAELRKLSVAIEQSPSVIVITNLQAEIEYVNDAFTRSTGYTFGEVKGRNLRFLKSGMTPPETFREMWDALTVGKTWRGELANRRKDGEIYWEYTVIAPTYDAEGNVTHYVAVKEDITARKVAEAKLEQLAVTEPLTGLLNRRGFFLEAEKIYARSQRPPYELAALMMDIDHFKNVNDRYGHQSGDAVLREIAARLRDNLRPTDIIARYGGEEFVALLPRTSLDTLTQITQRLNAAVREQPIEYNRINISITISIGAIILTAESRSLDELLTQADQAMYQAKAAGRNCTVVFNSSRCEDVTENK
ncbi:MAG TPA: diguanylate cyclase [Anaerolineales bacterium]|nr:diguanylate cyclase [Anaerolineales bacterium]